MYFFLGALRVKRTARSMHRGQIQEYLRGVAYDINRPPDKSVQQVTDFFYFSTKTYVVGTQKNRLNEMVLLSTQNTC